MTENDENYIEVDFYVMGVYRGKKKIGRNSICGLMLSGDYLDAMKKTAELQDSINKLSASGIDSP